MAVFEIADGDNDSADIRTMTVPTGSITKGAFYAIGNLLGFALQTLPEVAAANQPSNYNTDREIEFAYVVKCKKVWAAKATGAIAAGTTLYYDSAGSVVTTESTGSFKCGTSAGGAASADTRILMDFDGTLNA